MENSPLLTIFNYKQNVWKKPESFQQKKLQKNGNQ